MTIQPNTAMRLSPDDKAMLRELASRLQRSQTDTVRLLVRGALQIMQEQESKVKVDRNSPITVV